MSNITRTLAQYMPWLQTTNPDPIEHPELTFKPDNNTIFEKFTRDIYNETLNSLSNNKAEGPDGVPNEIIKALPPRIHDIIYRSMQYMWETGVTLEEWMQSYMILLHKKDDPIELGNWRPICLANTMYKLWTSNVTRVMADYAEEHTILRDSQQGFRRIRNTRKQINRLLSVIEDARLEHNELHLLYVDFTNAFGSTDHTKLNHIMHHLGFTQDVINIVGGIYSGEKAGPKMTTSIITTNGTSDPI
jgi:hypothetical protein